VGIAACLLSGCGTPEQITGANWSGPRESPQGREFTPQRVIRHQISGWVLLQCVAGENHSVRDCIVIGEYPHGEGFGEAALRMRSGLKGQDAFHYGGHPPEPGEVFLFPLAFCQPGRDAECAQMKAGRDAYRLQLIVIAKLVHTGHCDDAQAAAADTDQPAIIRLVAKFCASPSSATN
jgi:hypothetical protein